MSGILERFEIDLDLKNGLGEMKSSDGNIQDCISNKTNLHSSDDNSVTNCDNSVDKFETESEHASSEQNVDVSIRDGVSQAVAGVSTFVIAYTLHKMTAPFRIGLTLTATPVIVRYLRVKGVLKPPVNKK